MGTLIERSQEEKSGETRMQRESESGLPQDRLNVHLHRKRPKSPKRNVETTTPGKASISAWGVPLRKRLQSPENRSPKMSMGRNKNRNRSGSTPFEFPPCPVSLPIIQTLNADEMLPRSP